MHVLEIYAYEIGSLAVFRAYRGLRFDVSLDSYTLDDTIGSSQRSRPPLGSNHFMDSSFATQ